MTNLVEQDMADLPVCCLTAIITAWLGGDSAIPTETARIGDEFAGHGRDRQREIDQARGDRGRWHAAKLRRDIAVCDLSQCQPASLRDRLDTKRAVAAAAGEHDADGRFPLILRQRTKED